MMENAKSYHVKRETGVFANPSNFLLSVLSTAVFPKDVINIIALKDSGVTRVSANQHLVNVLTVAIVGKITT